MIQSVQQRGLRTGVDAVCELRMHSTRTLPDAIWSKACPWTSTHGLLSGQNAINISEQLCELYHQRGRIGLLPSNLQSRVEFAPPKTFTTSTLVSNAL